MLQAVLWAAKQMEPGFLWIRIFLSFLYSPAVQSQLLSAKFPLSLIFNLKKILLHSNESKIIPRIFCHLVKYGQAEWDPD